MDHRRSTSPRAAAPLRHVLLLAVALCSSGCEDDPAPPDTLRLGLESSPRDLDPRFGSDESARRVHSLIHAGLVRALPDGRAEADLAERWEVLGPTRTRFWLRDGLRFSDGRPLTAEDVRATLLSVSAPASRSFRHGDLLSLADVEIREPVVLDVVLHEPFAPLLANLSLGILPAEDTGGTVLGAGPYRVVRWAPDREVVLEANPHFHGPPPGIPRIQMKIVPRETARALELEKGTLDLVVNDLPPDLVAGFEGRREFQVVRSPGNSYAYIGFNLRDPVLADRRVRRAIACAVDRDAMVRHLLGGRARLATGMLPPENWAYVSVPAPPHDPEEAVRLLEEAGHRAAGPGLPRLRLTYKTSGSELALQQAQVIQEQLRSVGIALQVRSADWSSFYEDVIHGRFQLYSMVWTEILDPDVLRLRFGSAYVPPAGLNRGAYENPTVDLLLEGGRRETSTRRRREIYRQVQEILARELPYVSLWHRDNLAVARWRVRDVYLSPTADLRELTRARLRAQPR